MPLSYPKIKTKLPGPKAQKIIERDKKVLSPSYTRDYPLVIGKGRGLCVEDVDGNLFLDMTAGIAVTTTGHSHPNVVKAIKRQADAFLHMSGTDFYYTPQVELAEKLGELMPGPEPKKVFFCNSGTEAIEAAIKLARHHTGRKQLIAFLGAFHGRTCGALSLTASKTIQKEGFLPLLPGVHHATFPNPQNCPNGMTPEEYATDCINWIRDKLFQTILPPKQVAAVVVEPIQGEGGYVIPPPNFHRELHELCKESGILYILDEIQTGMGRTGKFFACEHFGVQPDIITMAKGIASGMPLGAMISRAEIMDWPPGAHASTFGGNPLACTAALETIKLVEKELMANAESQGNALKEGLYCLKNKYDAIAYVRGLGLLLAIEIGNDENMEESIALRNEIIQKAYQKGLLLLACGIKSIRLSPALCISRDEVEMVLGILDKVFHEIST